MSGRGETGRKIVVLNEKYDSVLAVSVACGVWCVVCGAVYGRRLKVPGVVNWYSEARECGRVRVGECPWQ